LQGADPSDAHLQKAHIRGADLRDAKLCRADLQGADLSKADLRGADLTGANLKKALLNQTQFAEVYTFTPAFTGANHDTYLEGEEQRPVRAVHQAAVAA
jgi:uncharacterized protein YjbI with pentapeptide repeats